MISELTKIVTENFKNCGYDIEAKIIVSNRKELCDYQCDDAFKLTKEYKKSPIEIGESVVASLNSIKNFDDIFKKVEFVKPGFINMTLSDSFINKEINKIFEDDNYSIKKPDVIETYYMDYGGPNVAKPLHVGHLRTAVIGESIKRIISFTGHKTIADVHLGDYGLQIGQVIYAVLEDGLSIDEITLEYLDVTYPKMSKLCKEDSELLSKCALITKELQEGNLEYQRLFKKIYDVSVTDIKRLYNYLSVSFDLWLGESDSYKYINTIETDLKSLLEESNGALVIDVKDSNDTKEIPPLIFKKSNGAYLYGTTDLASIYERVIEYKADNILYVVDNRQSLHFEQLFRVCKKWNLTKNTNFKHLSYGTVNGSDGKPFKTRSGDAFKLDDLFKEIKEVFINSKETNKDMSESDLNIIVNSIIKFADLQNNREKDYIFDIEKFSNVVGKTGPYILYTYVRMNKILTNEKITVEKLNDIIYNVIDRDLRVKLLQLNKVVEVAFKEKMPNYIAEYVYELAVCCNSFYQANHINGLEEVNKQQWLLLINYTNKLIKKLLELLVIDIPTKM